MAREVQSMVYAALFAALTAVGAFMAVPIGPVPITLQVLFVLLAGALLGARWGAVSMTVYLLLGVIGLPVFAKGGSGIGAILGPTGGYLISYVPAAYVTGWLIEKRGGKIFTWNIVAMAVGLLIIYALGVAQLMNFNKWALDKAIAIGVVPFVLVDSLKILVAAFIAARVDLYNGPTIYVTRPGISESKKDGGIFSGRVLIGLILVLIVAGVGYYGYSQYMQRTAFEKVQITPSGYKVSDIGLTSASIELDFTAYNPGDRTATLDRLEYQVYVNNQFLVDGAIPNRYDIYAHQTRTITTKTSVSYLNLGLGVWEALTSENAQLRITGVAHVGTPIGTYDYPFEKVL